MLSLKNTRTLSFCTQKQILGKQYYTHFVLSRSDPFRTRITNHLGIRPIFINGALHYQIYLGGPAIKKEMFLLPENGKVRLGPKIFKEWSTLELPPELKIKLKRGVLELIPKVRGAEPFSVMHHLVFVGNGHHILFPKKHLDYFGISHSGVNHEEDFCNEDRILFFEDSRGNKYFALAEGLGGRLYGERASKYSTDIIKDSIQKEAGVDLAIHQANKHLLQLLPSSGTTLAMVQVSPQKISTSFSIGNSRIHIFDKDGNKLSKNQIDISVVENKGGKLVRRHSNTLGLDENLIIHKEIFNLPQGGWIFLYSGKIDNNIPRDMIPQLVNKRLSPKETAEALMHAALSNMEYNYSLLPQAKPGNASIIAIKID